jgi:hypothetical protein
MALLPINSVNPLERGIIERRVTAAIGAGPNRIRPHHLRRVLFFSQFDIAAAVARNRVAVTAHDGERWFFVAKHVFVAHVLARLSGRQSDCRTDAL